MLEIVTRQWWVVGLRGLAALLFGILALIWPGVTLLLVVLFFGCYAFADGILPLGMAFTGSTFSPNTFWLIFLGLIDIAAGIVAFAWPAITALVLLFIIALWATVSGIVAIMMGIQLCKELEHEWLLILGGAAAIVLGLLLFLNPGPGAVVLIRVVGALALLVSIPLLILAWRLRDLHTASSSGGGFVSTSSVV